MNDVWKCPNGHINSFKVIEHSPDINCTVNEDAPCEECGIAFDDKTWASLGLEYDDWEDYDDHNTV